MRKKLLTPVLVLTAVAMLMPSVCADEPEISAQSAIVMHSGGEVVFAKNADERRLIASTTKLMTALLAIENCELDRVVTVEPDWCGLEGSSMYLRAGQRLTIRELTEGLLCASGNDAAAALACIVSGSIESFARLMNERAESLGLTDTHFENPHGLDSDTHYSTAHDLAKLMDCCMANADFTRLIAEKSCRIGELTFVNHNKLLTRLEGCIGGKTGYTEAAGRCLVSCCERDGTRFICVTLAAPDDWNDHAALYELAFSQWSDRTLLSPEEHFFVPYANRPDESVCVAAETELRAFLPRDAQAVVTVELPAFVLGPVTAGDAVGRATAYLDGEELCSVRLICTETKPALFPYGDYFMKARLQKLISASGAASRRAAEQMIADGRVTVNGVRASVGDSADPESDRILLDGKPLPQTGGKRYIMLNKPKGYVTTLSDEKGRPCVTELVRGAGERLYPVGRLDMYSEGLLILTNDGDFANRLMHPSHNITKTYETTVTGADTDRAAELLRRPMEIDGCIVRAVDVTVMTRESGSALLSITIGEGRNRQVRKMCEKAGLKVTRLCRVREGALTLGELPSGKWRELTEDEVRSFYAE